jgi:hypothetical protein
MDGLACGKRLGAAMLRRIHAESMNHASAESVAYAQLDAFRSDRYRPARDSLTGRMASGLSAAFDAQFQTHTLRETFLSGATRLRVRAESLRISVAR